MVAGRGSQQAWLPISCVCRFHTAGMGVLVRRPLKTHQCSCKQLNKLTACLRWTLVERFLRMLWCLAEVNWHLLKLRREKSCSKRPCDQNALCWCWWIASSIQTSAVSSESDSRPKSTLYWKTRTAAYLEIFKYLLIFSQHIFIDTRFTFC